MSSKRRPPRRLAPLVGMPSVHEGPTTVLPRLDAETMARLDTDLEAGQDPIVSYSPETAGFGRPTTETGRLRVLATETQAFESPSRGPRHSARSPTLVPTAPPGSVPAPASPVEPPSGPEPAPAATPSPPVQYRPELQGLRALAALAVVVYHVWVGRVSGGVDIFFVITGFLASGQLVRACERGTVDVVAYWGRTLRRLAPPTAIVLIATIAAAMVLLPESRWGQTIGEVIASALFIENWRLAADSVDYYAAHNTASVVQHFWSLSIQVQFALVFPVLIVVAALLAHRAGRSVRSGAWTVLVTTTAASFAFSVILTPTEQKLAYFHSLTRLWEFTIGGLLALAIGSWTLPTAVRWVLGWAGVAGLVSCGMVLDVEGGFPGYLALWPVLSACAILVAGTTGVRSGADRLLSTRPLRYLGDISFPLYLWHWPVLLFTLLTVGVAEPGVELGLLVVGLSLALAAATYHLVETPLRPWSPIPSARWAGHVVVAMVMIPVLAMTLMWSLETSSRAEAVGSVGDPDHPGAQALAPDFTYRGTPGVAPLPPAVAAFQEWVEYKNGCSNPQRHPNLEVCTWVPAPGPPTKTIVVVGDSHMQQFLPAVAPIARERGWQVLTMIRPGCPFSTSSDSNIGEVDCQKWNESALAELEAMKPAAVVAAATHNVRAGLSEATPPGFVDAWRRMEQAGIPVMAVRDNPRFTYSPPSCTDAKGRNAAECTSTRDQLYASPGPFDRAGAPGNVTYFDTAAQLCDARACPPEIGNVTVYLDDNHLTRTFTASMAPAAGQTLVRATGG